MSCNWRAYGLNAMYFNWNGEYDLEYMIEVYQIAMLQWDQNPTLHPYDSYLRSSTRHTYSFVTIWRPAYYSNHAAVRLVSVAYPARSILVYPSPASHSSHNCPSIWPIFLVVGSVGSLWMTYTAHHIGVSCIPCIQPAKMLSRITEAVSDLLILPTKISIDLRVEITTSN